jgi:RNA polymerase sigma-70 factor (ECF subfamily)
MHQSEEEIKKELLIIEKAKQNPEVFGVLYEKYFPEIFKFIFKRIGNEDFTSDLTSQVFLKSLINLPKYEYRGLPFSAWLYRIAVNQLNEFFRNHQQERWIQLDEKQIQSFFDESEALFDLKSQNIEELLTKLLEQLDDDEVELIELRYLEELSFKEVAYILNITENNAKVRTYRILEKLRKFSTTL